ncbi:MAG: glycosyltransferase family 39 protein [Candidatus Obscuribacterales bacterium]|nr:glycosyltransferase family 39 protein [Candidatus Obscuribacterales bacterium]
MNSSTTNLAQEKVREPLLEGSTLAWSSASNWALVFTFVVGICVYFNALGSVPLFNPDEALYAEPAREMLQNGDWLTTHLNYIVRYTKPPLVIWAQALLFSVLGVSEFAARSFGAACGVVLVVVTQAFVTRYVNLRAGIAAGFSLMTAPLFFGTARECITDVPLSLFLGGAIMAFYAAFREKRSRVLAVLGYILIALAVMTKGPVAIVLPVAILGSYYLSTGGLKEAWQRFFPLVGALIVAVLALPWFVLEIAATKGEYFQEFFVRENFQRFTSEVDSHKAPIWYHVAAVMGGFLPFSLYLPQSVAETLGALRQRLQTAFSGGQSLAQKLLALPAALKQLEPVQSLQYFAVLWLFITVAFFSVSVSKLLPYTLPAFPAAAILFALEIERAVLKPARWRLLIPLLLTAFTCTVAYFVMPFALSKVRNLPDGVLPLAQNAWAAMALAMGTAAALVLANRKQIAVAIVLAAQVMLCVMLAIPLTLKLSQAWEGPLPEMSRYVGKVSEPAFVFDMRKPGVPFYAHRQMSQAWTWAALTSELSRIKCAYIITRSRNKPPLLEMPGYTVIKEEGLYVLLRFDNPFPPTEPYTPSPGIHSMQR